MVDNPEPDHQQQAKRMREWRHQNISATREYNRKYAATFRAQNPESVKRSADKYRTKAEVIERSRERAAQWQRDNRVRHNYSVWKTQAKQFLSPKPAKLAALVQYSKQAYVADLQLWADCATTLAEQVDCHAHFKAVKVKRVIFPALDKSNEYVKLYRDSSRGALRFLGLSRRNSRSNIPERAFNLDRHRYANDLRTLASLAIETINQLNA